MERTFIAENEKARKKLVGLAEAIRAEDLELDAGEGWKVATVFAHMAFWDQRTVILLRRWKKAGTVTPSPVDTEVINEALTPFLNALPPREAVSMAVRLAEEASREIEGVTAAMAEEIEAVDRKRLHRYHHWNAHIDQIERVFQAK